MQVTYIFLIIMHLFSHIKSQMEPFIVGGEDANITDFPYSAVLAIEVGKYSWICGSSIVNQHVVLTAAHCLFNCTPKTLIMISVGHENKKQGIVSSAHSFVLHEHFVYHSLHNDIGLVRLKTPLVFNASISRVALMSHPPYQEDALIAGWGYSDEGTKIVTHDLQFVKQYVWSREECQRHLSSLPVGTFCASSKAEGYPTAGDSGSALVVRDYIQIGIVSFKRPIISRSVIVYTDTGYFFDWIERNTIRIVCFI